MSWEFLSPRSWEDAWLEWIPAGLKRRSSALHCAACNLNELPAHLTRPEYIEQIRQKLRKLFANGTHQLKKRYLSLLLDGIESSG